LHVFSGLLTAVLKSSPTWRALVIDTGAIGLSTATITPVVTFQDMQNWFLHHHTARKAAGKLVMLWILPLLPTIPQIQPAYIRIRTNCLAVPRQQKRRILQKQVRKFVFAIEFR
jgi:hypothetical protein